MKIPNFSGLRPSPPFKDSTYTVICYLPRLWVLVRERAPCGKISGGSRKYRKGVDHREGGSTRKGGGLQSCAELWRAFHGSTTCCEKKLFRSSSLHWVLESPRDGSALVPVIEAAYLVAWPCCIAEKVKNLFGSTLSTLFAILYVCIMSPLLLLSIREGNVSCKILSL